MTRYVIIGAGAVGGTFAAELHRAGIETLLVARGAHLAALREHGLRYVRPDGVTSLRLPVAGGPAEAELREGDVLLFATKTQDTAAAMRDWAGQPVKRADGRTGLAATDLTVVTAQNGLDNERSALRHFRRVVGAVVWIPAGHLEPGEVVSPGTPAPGIVWIGAYPSGDGAGPVAADLRRAGFTAQEVRDIQRWKAGKLLGNLGNALDALYRPSPLRDRAAELLRDEGRRVLADLEPADLRTESTVDLTTMTVAPIPGHERGGSSTWQSLARSAPPETDYLNGEVVLRARLRGGDAPANDAVRNRVLRAVAERTAAGSLGDDDLRDTLPALAGPPVLISAADLYARLAQPGPPVLLDVRWALGDPHGAEHYRAGHISGAVYVDLDTELSGPHDPAAGRHPMPSLDALQAAARRWGVTRRRGVVVYDNSGGLAAARAWWLLRWAGVPDVRLLDGGLAAWAAAGYDQATGDAHPQPPSDIVLDGGHLPTLTADDAAELARTGTLLDARAGERYRGEVEPVDPRAGHIPGAISAPTTQNLESGVPVFKPAAELRDRFAGLAGPIGVYCGSGVTAAHEIAALAVAGIDAALFPGSWSAWSQDPDRPVATEPEGAR
jgi:thiosulfate/3-mercaptopyruvate sulfurtransferase